MPKVLSDEDICKLLESQTCVTFPLFSTKADVGDDIKDAKYLKSFAHYYCICYYKYDEEGNKILVKDWRGHGTKTPEELLSDFDSTLNFLKNEFGEKNEKIRMAISIKYHLFKVFGVDSQVYKMITERVNQALSESMIEEDEEPTDDEEEDDSDEEKEDEDVKCHRDCNSCLKPTLQIIQSESEDSDVEIITTGIQIYISYKLIYLLVITFVLLFLIRFLCAM